ncbi:MAG: GNAT family N-acetyltransferase [Albidovulum sp.]
MPKVLLAGQSLAVMSENPHSDFLVRPFHTGDGGAVVRMVTALAAFHGDTARIDEDLLARDAGGASPWIRILIAEADGTLIGYAAFAPLHHLQYSRRGLDMHHLFVAEAWRGKGVGSALVEAGAALARSLDCGWLSVGADAENRAAQDFYLARGFAMHPYFGVRLRRLLAGD